MEYDHAIKRVTDHTVIGKTYINGRRQSNAGAIILKNYIVAIDPSPDLKSAKIYRKNLEERFGKPVKIILITHYHGDHTFGVKAFENMIVIGTKNLLERMKSKLTTDWYHIKDEITLPNLILTDKLRISDNGFDIDIFNAKGHTNCSSYAYFVNEKVLFAGDLVFAEQFPWAGDISCDPDKWIEVFKDFLKLDYSKLIPGHGPIVGKEEVKKQLEHFQKLRDATIKAIMDNKSVFDIERPEFYQAASESVIIRTLQHFYKFYSAKKR